MNDDNVKIRFPNDWYEGPVSVERMVDAHHRVESLFEYCPTDHGMYGPRRSPNEHTVGKEDPEHIGRLSRALDFPRLLADDDGYVREPLESALERAQRRIDEALDELTDEQRFYYERASSYVVLEPREGAAAGNGARHIVTLRQGGLRLEDDLTSEGLLKVWWGDYPKGPWPQPGMLQSLAEVRAYVSCVPYSVMRYDKDEVWRVWDELAPLMRAGRIDANDIAATMANTETLDHRDRANECLSYHRLVHEQGWNPDRAETAVYFAMSLHQAIGEDGFDLADELLRWGDIAGRLWDDHWELCDRITVQAEWMGTGFHERHIRGTDEERILAGIAKNVLAALNRRDAEAALAALEMFSKREHGPVEDDDDELFTFEDLIIGAREALANAELPEDDWNWWVPLKSGHPFESDTYPGTTEFQTCDLLGYLERFDPYCSVDNPLHCAKPIERYADIGEAKRQAECARDALWNTRFTDGGDGGEANG